MKLKLSRGKKWKKNLAFAPHHLSYIDEIYVSSLYRTEGKTKKTMRESDIYTSNEKLFLFIKTMMDIRFKLR